MELPALFNERDVALGALRIAQAAVGQAQDLVIAANGPGQLQGRNRLLPPSKKGGWGGFSEH